MANIMIVSDGIKARCQQSRVLAAATTQLAPVIRPCCRRHDFATCAVELALEHQRSHVQLVEAGELGSAAALFRPLLEAAASASWLIYAATDEEILTLPTDPNVLSSPHDIPMLGDMATALLPYFPDMSIMIAGLARKGAGAARWLHKFTHGGTPQLARRERMSGWLELEVIAGLIRSDMFAIAALSNVTVRCPDPAFRSHVFMTRDRLAAEMNETIGSSIPLDRPHELPVPDKACCGSPLFMA
jgi:hypothetical protein